MSKSQCNVNLMVFTIEVFGVRKPLKRLMEEAFFFFFFYIVKRVSLIQTDGTCLRARWQMLAITSPIIINGRPWLMGLWLPLHYGMSLPSFLRGELE